MQRRMPRAEWSPPMSTDKDLKKVLPVAGKELPEAKREAELRNSVLISAGIDPATVPPAAQTPQLKAPKKPIYRSRLALAGGIAFCVIVALVIVGVASMSSMPGDALYPVKRFLQRTRVVLAFGSGAKASASRANAEARVKELKYAKSKDMRDWYAPLAKSATSDLQQSIQGSSSEAAKSAQQRLKELRELSKDLEPEEGDGLQKALDNIEQQIDQKYEQNF